MANKKMYSGFNDKTAENLLLDAGAFFKNWDMKTDDFDKAVAAGKLLGATRGGGSFDAKPSVRAIDVDGVKGVAKGLQVIDQWDVSISANILEVSVETLKTSLAASEIDTESLDEQGYQKISAKNFIDGNDYIDNVTFVGKISGKDKPIIIQVQNAMNVDGLSLSVKNKDEAVIAMKFTGSYDASKLDEPPFAIYYPKA